MTKLYQDNPNKKIEKFTVGNDYLLDKKLLKYDCIASIAHSKMLKKIKILTQEDSHTAIENYLTEQLGELGKKIHAARSRNDQVVAAMKLYEKDELIKTLKLITNLITSLTNLSKKDITMPGYTHMQKAMPSSIKLWSESFIESLEDDTILLDNAINISDQE